MRGESHRVWKDKGEPLKGQGSATGGNGLAPSRGTAYHGNRSQQKSLCDEQEHGQRGALPEEVSGKPTQVHAREPARPCPSLETHYSQPQEQRSNSSRAHYAEELWPFSIIPSFRPPQKS